MYVLVMTDSDFASEWTSRPVSQALTAEKLAALVDRSLDAMDTLLFTTTPREELDQIGQFQRLKDLAFAGQLRAIVAAHTRATAAQRFFAGDEVGLALGTTPTTGGTLVMFALDVAALPGLLEALETGLLTERHLRAVMSELDLVTLTLEQRQAIALVLLARFTGQTPGELAKLVKRLVLTVDRAAAQTRQDLATTKRRVRTYDDTDGQGIVFARGPLAQIAAIKAALQKGRTPTTPSASGDAGTDDERSADEREFDLFVQLLTGGIEAGTWQAQIVVPFSTATGGDLELADIPGLGPILPSTAHDLLDLTTTLTPVAVDPDGHAFAVGDPTPGPAAPAHTPAPAPAAAAPAPAAPGSVGRTGPAADFLREALPKMTIAPTPRPLSTDAYRPTDRIVRFVAARDRTCVFPGCHRTITDTDHRIPWPLGPTDARQLQCLCRHHHRAKQAVFTVTLTPDDDYRWTTRGGWQFTRKRLGY